MSSLSVSTAGMRLINTLVGTSPKSIEELVEAAGVTRTAVTEQLNELLDSGFVQRERQRLVGRGRPRYVYSTTDHALACLFPANQALVVPAMWQAIEKIGGAELKAQVIDELAHALADHYRKKIKAKTPANRLAEMARLLCSTEGNQIEVKRGKGGKVAMLRRSCSFFSMFEESRTVCCLDQRVLSEVVGAEVRRTASRHDGHPCCVFQLNGDSK